MANRLYKSHTRSSTSTCAHRRPLCSPRLLLVVICAIVLLGRLPSARATAHAPLWRIHSPSKRSLLPRLSIERHYKRSTVPGTDVERGTFGNQTAAVIFLHGLGSNADHSFQFIEKFPALTPWIRYITPNSEIKQVTAVSGLNVMAWFNMKSLDNANSTELPTGEDEASMRASVARVHTIVEAQISRGIAPERIVLGGFSQGCVTTLLALISSPRQLQGMFCESGWLALSEHLEQRNGKIVHMLQNTELEPVPIFWGYGDKDTVVPPSWVQQSQEILREMGYNDIDSHEYKGLIHWSLPQEQDDLESWLTYELPENF